MERVDALIRQLNSWWVSEQREAAELLGQLGDPKKAMRHPNPLMSQYATESLQRFLILHPDAILRAAPKDRNLIGRLFQDAARDELVSYGHWKTSKMISNCVKPSSTRSPYSANNES